MLEPDGAPAAGAVVVTSAGGKAVFLRFGPVADTACGDPTTQASRYWIHRDSFQVESLAPGSIWVQELMQCHPDDCVTSGSVKLEISANLESEVRGSFEIREREGNSTKTRTGRAILKKCPMTQPGCF